MRQTRRDFLGRAVVAGAATAAGPLAGLPLVASAQTRGLNARDFGARGDGAADDHAAIQSAIQAAAQRGGSVFLPAGAYRVTRRIEWPAGASVSLSGEGADKTTLVGGRPYDTVLYVHGSAGARTSGVTISDLAFDLENTKLANALHVYDVSGLTVRRVHFRNSTFKFVQCDVRGNVTPSDHDSEHVTYEDCVFEHHRSATDESVTIANTDTIVFRRCRWSDCQFAGVLLYQLVEHATFEDCEFDNISHAGSSGFAEGLIYSLSCNDIHVNRCKFTSVQGTGLFGANTSDHGAFGFKYVAGLSLEHCRFSRCGAGYEVGAVKSFSDESSVVELCKADGVRITAANFDAALPSRDVTLHNTIIRNNNQGGTFPRLHPGLLVDRRLAGVDLGLQVIGCQIYDDQPQHTQLYAMTVDGGGSGSPQTFRGINVDGSRLESYAPGAKGITLLNAVLQ